MGERLKRVWGWCVSCLKALARGVWRLLSALGRALSRTWRLAEVGRQSRALERRRSETFEALGKMVYLLYKRNLVRNADLLAECEKLVTLDAERDQLTARADRIRCERPGGGEPAPAVAATPLDMPHATGDEPVALEDAVSPS